MFELKCLFRYSAEDSSDGQEMVKRKPHAESEVWYCREPWFGDSRDGLLQNGDGYHYFSMKGDGVIVKAIEWYESDDGEEHVCELPELVGLNWFSFFGFEDDELLDHLEEHQFYFIEQLLTKK